MTGVGSDIYKQTIEYNLVRKAVVSEGNDAPASEAHLYGHFQGLGRGPSNVFMVLCFCKIWKSKVMFHSFSLQGPSKWYKFRAS